MKYKAIVSSNIYGEKSSEVKFFASFEELMERFYGTHRKTRYFNAEMKDD